jgi:hypothetical protein
MFLLQNLRKFERLLRISASQSVSRRRLCAWPQVRDVKFQLDEGTRKLNIVEPAKRLIITSGDTSDVDGFLALAEYSKASAIQVEAFTAARGSGRRRY